MLETTDAYYDTYSVMCGLSSRTRRQHVVRAALEAVCHQTQGVAAAMAADCAPLRRMLADGGMAQNALLMQMQADVLGIPLVMFCVTAGSCIAGVPSNRAWQRLH